MQMMPLLTASSIFLAVVLLIMGLYYLYDQTAYSDPTLAARRMRVDADAGVRAAAIDIVRRDAMSQESWHAALLNRFAPLDRVRRLLKQANTDMPLSVFLLLTGLFAFAGIVIASVLRLGVLPVLLAGGAGASLPYLYQSRRRSIRIRAIEAQLPDALDLISRTLLAGHAFIMGMKMVGEQMDDPIRAEFQKCFDEISFGISVADSMKELSERIDSIDVKFFVTSVLIQLETGGNLAEIVQGIAKLIRARFELAGKIQALTAEGRISAQVMFALPVFISMALSYINPSYMAVLFFDPAGHKILGVGLTMMVLGMIVTRRMIQIKV